MDARWSDGGRKYRPPRDADPTRGRGSGIERHGRTRAFVLASMEAGLVPTMLRPHAIARWIGAPSSRATRTYAPLSALRSRARLRADRSPLASRSTHLSRFFRTRAIPNTLSCSLHGGDPPPRRPPPTFIAPHPRRGAPITHACLVLLLMMHDDDSASLSTYICRRLRSDSVVYGQS